MFCEKCGKQLKSDSRFCPSCGQTVSPGSSVTAPSSGNETAFRFNAGAKQVATANPAVFYVRCILIAVMIIQFIFTVGIFTFNTIKLAGDDDYEKFTLLSDDIVEGTILEGRNFLCGAIFFIELGLTVSVFVLFICSIVMLLKRNCRYECASKLAVISIILVIAHFFRFLFVFAFRSMFTTTMSKEIDEALKEYAREVIKTTPSTIICTILMIVLCIFLNLLKNYILIHKVDGDKYTY